MLLFFKLFPCLFIFFPPFPPPPFLLLLFLPLYLSDLFTDVERCKSKAVEACGGPAFLWRAERPSDIRDANGEQGWDCGGARGHPTSQYVPQKCISHIPLLRPPLLHLSPCSPMLRGCQHAIRRANHTQQHLCRPGAAHPRSFMLILGDSDDVITNCFFLSQVRSNGTSRS